MVDPLENLDKFVLPVVEPVRLPMMSFVVETRPGMMDRIRRITKWHRRWFSFTKEIVMSYQDPMIPGTEFVKCDPPELNMDWSTHYSHMCIRRLNSLCEDDFMLLWQWDGFVLNPGLWTNDFMKWDYLGSPIVSDFWYTKATELEAYGCLPEWKNPLKPGIPPVGNGGFTLRSKKFLEESAALSCQVSMMARWEDMYLCVERRKEMEAAGVQYGPLELAFRFSKDEDDRRAFSECFGFHDESNLEGAKCWLEKCWLR